MPFVATVAFVMRQNVHLLYNLPFAQDISHTNTSEERVTNICGKLYSISRIIIYCCVFQSIGGHKFLEKQFSKEASALQICSSSETHL